MNVESVYRRTICVGSEGLKNGSRLNAAWTKASSASVSKKSPARYSLVVPVRVVMDYLFSHKEAHKARGRTPEIPNKFGIQVCDPSLQIPMANDVISLQCR